MSKIIQESGSSYICRYAVCNIVGVKDEDRYYCNATHSAKSDGGVSSMASFSVFDGHASNLAAEYCRRKMNTTTVKRYKDQVIQSGGDIAPLEKSEFTTSNLDILNKSQTKGDGDEDSSNRDVDGVIKKGIEDTSPTTPLPHTGSNRKKPLPTDLITDSDLLPPTPGRMGSKISGISPLNSSNNLAAMVNDDGDNIWNDGFDGYLPLEGKSTKYKGDDKATRVRTGMNDQEIVDSMLDISNHSRRSRASSISAVGTHNNIALLDHEKKHDAVLTNAIIESTLKIDKRIRNYTTSGSTMVSLYLKKMPDGSVKSYCANTGDSRCCLVALQKEYTSTQKKDHTVNKDLTEMTLDDLDASAHSSVWNMSSHSLTSSHNTSDLNINEQGEGEEAEPMLDPSMPTKRLGPSDGQTSVQDLTQVLPKDLISGLAQASDLDIKDDESIKSCGSSVTPIGLHNHLRAAFDDDLDLLDAHGDVGSFSKITRPPLPPVTITTMRAQETLTVVCFAMSEDHKVQCERERERIRARKKPKMCFLPREATVAAPRSLIPAPESRDKAYRSSLDYLRQIVDKSSHGSDSSDDETPTKTGTKSTESATSTPDLNKENGKAKKKEDKGAGSASSKKRSHTKGSNKKKFLSPFDRTDGPRQALFDIRLGSARKFLEAVSTQITRVRTLGSASGRDSPTWSEDSNFASPQRMPEPGASPMSSLFRVNVTPKVVEKKRFFGDETPTISSPSIPPTTIKVSSSNGNDDGIDGNDDGGVDADSTDESEVTGEQQGGDPLDITVHTPKSSFEGKGMNLSPTSAGLGNVVDVEGSVIVKGISNPNPNPLKDNGERALRAPLQRNGSVVDLTSIPLEVLDADNSPENSESELSGLTLSDDNDGNYCSTMPLKPSTSTKPEKGESDKEKKSSSGSNNSGAVHDDGQEMVMTVSRSSKKDGEGLEILKSEGSITVPPVLYRHSFISHRCSEDRTIKGPEAVFGRHGVSIMMTRSLGDKFGPRSCVSIPEVAYATVQPGQFVRFIVASDGFWDVATYETVRTCAFKSKYKDPSQLAFHLADKAKRYRNKWGLRMDDITVIVVDINPQEQEQVNSQHHVVTRDVLLKDTGEVDVLNESNACCSIS